MGLVLKPAPETPILCLGDDRTQRAKRWLKRSMKRKRKAWNRVHGCSRLVFVFAVERLGSLEFRVLGVREDFRLLGCHGSWFKDKDFGLNRMP